MKLHFLGTAGYHPNDQRQTSCMFIPEVALMFDAGTGLYRAMPLIVKGELDVLISHAHLDHVNGLTFFLDIVALTQLKKIRVYGESAKLDAIKEHLFAELLFPILPPIEWLPLEEHDPKKLVGGGKLSWIHLEHPGGSVGYRIDWPKLSVAYITDTTSLPDSPYWKMVHGVDWLIHECNFTDSQQEFARLTGHSWSSAVLEHASKANVKRLILTHISPTYTGRDPLELEKVTGRNAKLAPAEIMVAEDGMIIPLTNSITDIL